MEVHFGCIFLIVKSQCKIKSIFEDIENFWYWQQGTKILNLVLKALEVVKRGQTLAAWILCDSCTMEKFIEFLKWGHSSQSEQLVMSYGL